MSSDNWAVDVLWVEPLELGDELVGSDNVEGGDAENLVRVELARLLEHFAGDGHGGVDRVGDDGQASVRAHFSRCLKPNG